MIKRLFLADERELDTQPEHDVERANLLSLGMGLILGCGIILGTLLGGLVGHFLLQDVVGFGPDDDIVIGGVVGAIVVAILAVISVNRMTHRMAAHQRQPSSPAR